MSWGDWGRGQKRCDVKTEDWPLWEEGGTAREEEKGGGRGGPTQRKYGNVTVKPLLFCILIKKEY